MSKFRLAYLTLLLPKTFDCDGVVKVGKSLIPNLCVIIMLCMSLRSGVDAKNVRFGFIADEIEKASGPGFRVQKLPTKLC